MATGRRQYGTGSVMQRCDPKKGCPPTVEETDEDGKVRKVRPEHSCKGLWIGRIEAGSFTDGTRRRIVVSGRTKAQCEGKLTTKAREVAVNGAPPPDVKARMTVKTWATQWLDMRERTIRPKSFANDATFVRRWIVPTIGRQKLSDLEPGHIRAVSQAVRDAGLSGTTALAVHTTLTTMLKAAVVEGHQVPQRLFLVERPKKSKSDRSDISVIETLRILKAAAQDMTWRTRWLVALVQGIRQGEALGLTWECVDLEAGLLDISWQRQDLPYLDKKDRSKGYRVPDEFEVRHLIGATHLVRPKTASGQRIIPIGPGVEAALLEARDRWTPNPWGLVWTGIDGRNNRERVVPVRPEQDRERWAALQAAADVQHPSGRPYHVHEMRHTTATILLELGVDTAIIEAILGHAALVKAYQHVRSDLAREALRGVSKMLQLTSE